MYYTPWKEHLSPTSAARRRQPTGTPPRKGTRRAIRPTSQGLCLCCLRPRSDSVRPSGLTSNVSMFQRFGPCQARPCSDSVRPSGFRNVWCFNVSTNDRPWTNRLHIHIYIYMYVFCVVMYMHIYMYIYMYIYICICININILIYSYYNITINIINTNLNINIDINSHPLPPPPSSGG